MKLRSCRPRSETCVVHQPRFADTLGSMVSQIRQTFAVLTVILLLFAQTVPLAKACSCSHAPAESCCSSQDPEPEVPSCCKQAKENTLSTVELENSLSMPCCCNHGSQSAEASGKWLAAGTQQIDPPVAVVTSIAPFEPQLELRRHPLQMPSRPPPIDLTPIYVQHSSFLC